ncbi:MAG: cytochrome c1 [Sphingomonadaceae bacterium]|jgi:ubiquinol-cytochrome c reductase cytochrome c1 subunit|nr:cytochrome c1 [Sphingomonadaceae bacterium]
MIRIFSLLVGAFFTVVLGWSFLVGAHTAVTEPKTLSAEKVFHLKPEPFHLSSDGVFGKFDRQQLQRGFKVYQEVCAACHSIKHVAFRDLAALGYNEAEVKAIAAKATVSAKDPLTGELKDRPGLPADKFPPVVYAGLGVPPDLSLITKARPNGPAYVHSLLTGYRDQPAELLKQFPEAKTGDGLHYNPYFANLNLAMAPPLTGEGQVTYSDGTKATVEQMSTDVTAFLVWTAEPKLEQRRQTGLWWLGFLLFATVLGYMAYRNIWAEKKGH